MPGRATLLAAVREHDQADFTQLVAAVDLELLRLAYGITGSRQQLGLSPEGVRSRLKRIRDR